MIRLSWVSYMYLKEKINSSLIFFINWRVSHPISLFPQNDRAIHVQYCPQDPKLSVLNMVQILKNIEGAK